MVYVTERESKEVDKDGKKRKFKTYHTFGKNGRRTDVKFTEDVENKPKENCFVEVDYNKINLNTRDRYPVLWVKEVLAIIPVAEEISGKNKAKIDDFFGGASGVQAEETNENT